MRTRHPRAVSNTFFILLLVALGAIAITFAVMYFQIRATVNNDESAKVVAVITGTDKTLSKNLDPRFKDADGDLVADAPASGFIPVDTLVFSYVAENPEDFKKLWKPFINHLEKTTGKKVEYHMAASTDDQLGAFYQRKLHVTGFNTGSVPMAVNVAGFVPAYTLGTSAAGGYLHTEIIVPADSSIKSPADLKGHTLTFVDPNSNSGYKAPLIMLKNKFDLLPERDYLIRYSYGHQKSIAGIADHTYEAAAVASDVLTQDVAEKSISTSQFRSIYSSDDYPPVAFGYAHDLPPDLVAKIRSAFETFKFEGDLQKHFAASKEDSFHPVNYKKDFELVRYIDDQIGKPYHVIVSIQPPATLPTSLPATQP